MVVKATKKIEAQVVEAIRRLQAVQGSTPREISNYIAQEYNLPGPDVKRHVQVALKRGVTYGILQRLKGGYYTYNQDILHGHPAIGTSDVELACNKTGRRKGRRKSGGSRKRRKSRRESRRRSRMGSRQRRRGKRKADVPEDMDSFETKPAAKQQKKGGSPPSKETPQSEASSVSDCSDEKRE